MGRGGGVSVTLRCTLLALTVAGLTAWAATGESGEGGEAWPCGAGECSHRRLNNNANNNRNRRTADALHHPPGHTRRERRQSVVVEGVGRGHRVPCTEPEKRQAACLRGQCFALNMGHLRHPFCQCPAKYEGSRCELLSAYYFLNYYAQVKKGALIGGVVVGVLLLIIAVSVYCSYSKGKRRRKERKNKPDDWGTASPKPPETSPMMTDGVSQV